MIRDCNIDDRIESRWFSYGQWLKMQKANQSMAPRLGLVGLLCCMQGGFPHGKASGPGGRKSERIKAGRPFKDIQFAPSTLV